MPAVFPLTRAENAGNMIHARAPQRIFPRSIEYHTQKWRLFGEPGYADFVNKHCSHLIISMTNSIKVNTGHTARYLKFSRYLEQFDVPITIFGLGVRSPTTDLSSATIPQEAIDLLRYMADRCGPIGVRGEFTARVFAELAGVTNTTVTGCPSFFSGPAAFRQLRQNLSSPSGTAYSYAGTRYGRPEEVAQFVKAVKGDGYYIEATNKENHRAHLQALRGEGLDIPSFLSDSVQEPARPGSPGGLGPAGRSQQDAVTEPELRAFYRNRYRLFRNPDDWLQFNREVISYGFGTRFHVNMATLLSGKPATWITHDTRTQEFCDFLRLPHVTLQDSVDMEPDDFRARADYEEMFDHLPALFENFAAYLAAHDLPYEVPRHLL